MLVFCAEYVGWYVWYVIVIIMRSNNCIQYSIECDGEQAEATQHWWMWCNGVTYTVTVIWPFEVIWISHSNLSVMTYWNALW